MRTLSSFGQLAFTLILLCLSKASVANPDYIYFSNGDTPENWVWVLGDPKNWWLPLDGNQGKSGSGKLKISPADYKGKGDAVTLEWSKKGTDWATANIAGRTTDLSKFEQHAELIVIAKVDKKVKGDVKLAMKCGEDCQGEVSIKEALNNAKPRQWFVLPIALDCFAQAGAKLENIQMPFALGTNTRLKLSIASIHIQAIADGEEGCVPNTTAPANNAQQKQP